MNTLIRGSVAAALAVGAIVVQTAIPTGPAAFAAGDPDVQLTKSSPAEVLYGDPITATLSATTIPPAVGPPTDGFNLSFTDTLPDGAVFGTSDPEPSQTIDLGPGNGTALVWENVADLLAGATVELSYTYTVDDSIFDIGDTVVNNAGAYVSDNPREIPDFDSGTGANIPNSQTDGFDTATASTTLIPFELTKSEPNAESELLRGVHDHKTVYTLTIDNNQLIASDNFTLVDYLPAGLEYLGCAAVDNTSGAVEEYPGSGRIDATPHPVLANACANPASVTTVTDPGTINGVALPNGVYTRVEWDAASLIGASATDDLTPAGLAPAASVSFDYAAAIPLRENVQATLANTTANLDNNTGPLTTDEQSLENFAFVGGDTDGASYSDDDTAVVSAEDLSIHKSVDTEVFVQGANAEWTLDIESSEYTTQTDTVITVTDLIPNGTSYVAGSSVIDTVTTPPTTGPTNNPDGTQEIAWDLPAYATPSSTTEIVFETQADEDYRAPLGGPVAANDTWTNNVSLTADATLITANDGSTTAGVTLPDDSSAGQTAGPVSILKEVATPVSGPLTCGDGSSSTWDPTIAREYSLNDRVCWRLSVSFPGQLDTLSPFVKDFLPAGYEYESWALGANNDFGSGVNFVSTADDLADGILIWDLEDADPSGDVFEVVVSSKLTDNSSLANADISANLMKFSFINTDGSLFQLREQADARYAEPILSAEKSSSPDGPHAGGDAVTYTVEYSNAGFLDAINATIADTLPIGINCADVTTLGGSTCTDNIAPARDVLTWTGQTVPRGSEEAPIGSGELDTAGVLPLSYVVTLPNTFDPSASLTNNVAMTGYDTATNTGDGDESFIGGPIADETIEIVEPTFVKTRTTSVTEEGNDADDQVAIGEEITYSLRAEVPAGTQITGASISDAMPAGVRVDSVTATLNGSAAPAGFVVGGTTLTFPDPYAHSGGAGADIVVLTIVATVTDVDTNIAGGAALENMASLVWSEGQINSMVSNTVVEPALAISKESDDPDLEVNAGQAVTYTLTVTNTGAVGHDLVVVDTLPVDVIPQSGGIDASNGDIIDGTGGSGMWTVPGRTITWNIPSLAATPAAGIELTYDTVIANPLTGGTDLVNSATVTGTSRAGVDPDERTAVTAEAFDPDIDGYDDDTTLTLVAPAITVTKSASPTTATIGDIITYTATATIPGGVVGFDATLLDTLPDGMSFRALTSVTCAEAGPTACDPARTATAISSAGDTGTIGFFIGDYNPGSVEPQVLTLIYTANVLDDAADVNDGDTLTNSLVAASNDTDEISGTPATVPAEGTFDSVSDPATADIDIDEPQLTIDKDVAGQTLDTDTRRAQPGDTLTYTVVVENPGTSPAYDVTVTDTPDARLTGYSFAPVAGVVNTDADPSDGSLEWTIAGPIAPTGDVTIVYSLTVPNTLDETDEVAGFEVVNTADIPTYFGEDPATRTATGNTYRPYGTGAYDVTADTVNIELDLASIGDRIWYDIDGDGVQDVGEPGLNGVGITITFLNGPGTADDEVFTTTTSGDGDWLVDELPGGSCTVEITSADIPAGLAPSYDLDDLLVNPDGDWAGTLAENDAKRDVDAGFTGAGSIGDLVWFDQDLSGTQNGNEPGLGGIDVTLVWGGPDGDLLDATDNVTYTTTTAADGSYLFDMLPAGPYQVTVDGADLPTGMSFVSDPDAGAADGVSLTTLTATGAGMDDLTRDFGAAGALSIGDTVYLDRDGNGSQAASGEPGLEGVLVTLTYAGADGILGGAGAADDITFTDTTDANGNYLFENLPPEDYSITIGGPLPSGAVNTGDPDTGGDSTSTIPLTADNFDQDFGYDVDSELGDRVWWDLDRDGVQDAGEPGINGATVTVTYLGPDNAAGGGDDLVFTTTTSGDGDWSITDIPDGNYVVAVTAGIPAGFDETYDDDDGTTSPDGISNVTLATLDDDQDFGYAGNSSIGDTVWLDLDGNGAQDGQETGIPDVTVTVTWGGPDNDVTTAGDNVTFTRVTDNNGEYSVEGLPAGEYEIMVDESTLPANLAVTYDVQGGTGAPTNTSVVVLAANTDLDTVDFGYQGDSSIGDTIYWDRNGDGDQDVPGNDTDEPGIGGVTVQLVWAGPDGDLSTTDDNATYTTTTANDGSYLFDGLPQGEFEVNVIAGLPAAMTNTDDEDDDQDSSTPVTLGANDDHDTADFGYNGSASIGDTVYLDLDGNGTQAASGEPGVPGQTVTLNFEGADGILGNADDIVLTTVTDANGNYSFDNLPDGDFRVTVVGGIADDATNSGDPDAGTANQSDVPITGGISNALQDFGYEGDNALGDTVWWDTNRDGTIGAAADEPRLPGVQVQITYAGADGILGGAGAADDIVITTETTDASGNYFVDGLPDGDYRVDVITSTLPAGMDNTFDADGTTVTPNDSSVVNLPGATTDNGQDFGYAGTGSIGDLVYFDRDGDGVRGLPADEPGIAGVGLTLTFAGADGILGGAGASDDITITQTAGPDGEYDFTGLPAGDYTVAVTSGIPTGAVNSDDPDVPGAPDIGDNSAALTLGTGEDNDAQDFGYDVDAGLGDRVWWDFNRDGVQDPGEIGVNGVTVTVTYFGLDGQPDSVSGGNDDEIFTTVTAGDGDWSITEIPEGNYSIELTGGVPAGFDNTFDPDNGTVTPDGSALLNGHSGLNSAQDFGIAGNSSIGDTVWLDLDGDGTINGQEVGLEGVTVNLTWGGPDGIVGGANGADDIVIPVVTGPNGEYLFEGLPAGAYEVAVDQTTLPDGLAPSYDQDGTTVTPDGTTSVTLAADTDTDIDTVDFGFQGDSSIGDTIYFDRDRDGTLDRPGDERDEPGLAGVSVTLTWAGEDGILGGAGGADDHVFTTTTGPDGSYEFTGLPAGEYEVDVDTSPIGGLPIGVDNTVDEDGNNNSSTPVTLGVSDDHDTADFGYAGTASIGDTIYLDLDGDGVQGPNEPGVAGQIVTLTGPQGTFTTVTDADGVYSFDNLPDGAYTVTVVGGVADAANNTADPDLPPGAGDGTAAVTIVGGVSDDTIDFGYQGTAGLGDTIFFDTANDGVDDGAAVDPRLAGVDVVVVWHGPDGVFGTDDDVTIPVAPTDVDGTYAVTGLPTGTYTITPDQADLPAGLTPTVDADAGDDGTSTVTLGDDEINNDQDFAFTGTGSIGDTVWLDVNADGMFDADEPGFDGATVTVTWLGPDGVAGGGDDVVYTTTVADDGTYVIENLPAGEFTVEVSGLPDGLSGATTSTVALEPGEDDLDQDFPFVGSASVGDTVFLDVDDDGTQSPNEPGVGGVTVTVTSAGVDGVLGTDDDLVIVTTTEPDGTYSVPGIPPGPTQVSIDPGTLLPGTDPSADADGDDPAVSTIDLGDGENNVDQDFAIAGTGVITGSVDDEGTGDGIPGVVITITYDGPNGPVVITTTTGPDGNYTVSGLPTGDYTVEILPGDQPTGYISTGPTSVDVSITTDEPAPPDVDFPFVEPGSIGRTIYIDMNNNGTQDPGEGGAAGVTVTLLDADGNVVATVETDSDGGFVFDNLPPGTYTVVLDPTTFPPGLGLTVDPDGNNDGRFIVTIGPGEDSRAAVFGLAPPLLPQTGSGIGVLLRLASVLLAAGVVLTALRRRRSKETLFRL